MLEKIKKNFKKSNKRYSNKKNINMNELQELIEKGAVLVDVRSPQEFKEGHLNGAILIPEYEINVKHEKYFKSKNEIIVVYCSNGIRSKKAQKKLEKLGYTEVYNVFFRNY